MDFEEWYNVHKADCWALVKEKGTKAALKEAWQAGAESVVNSKLITDAIRLMRATGELSGWHEKADQLEAMIAAAQEEE